MITIDDQIINLAITIGGLILGIGGIVWKHANWLGHQFNILKDLVEKKTDELRGDFTEQLKYHERHDDQRFSEMNKTLQNIQMQNAIAAARDYQMKNFKFDQEDEDYYSSKPRARTEETPS